MDAAAGTRGADGGGAPAGTAPSAHAERGAADSTPNCSTSYGRLDLAVTPALRQLLQEGAGGADGGLPEELRAACKQHADGDRVPWRLAQLLCERSRRAPSKDRPPAWLHEAAAAPAAAPESAPAGVLFRSPPARPRPPALTRRLAKLQEALDDRRYAAMVADVTAEERRLAALSGDLFPTMRLQLSFGLHVVVTMGTAFALGFYGARYLTGGSPAAAALGGAAGMAAALLLETSLFIVRSNMPEPLDKKYAHLLARDWQAGAAAAATKGAPGGGGGGGGTAAAPAPAARSKKED